MTDAHEHDDIYEHDESIIEEDETPRDTVKKLRERLKECERERQEYLDGWQRAKADMVNLRRDANEREARAATRGIADIARSLADVVEGFDSAFASPSWSEVDQTWRAGIEGIHQQMVKALESHNVTFVDPTGERFDPHRHESIGIEPVPDADQDDVVMRTLQKGIVQGETLIRPAKVVVASYTGDANG
jgi:molecular chaperone GrpE